MAEVISYSPITEVLESEWRFVVPETGWDSSRYRGSWARRRPRHSRRKLIWRLLTATDAAYLLPAFGERLLALVRGRAGVAGDLPSVVGAREWGNGTAAAAATDRATATLGPWLTGVVIRDASAVLDLEDCP